MSTLPTDWKTTHLRNIAEFRNGINYAKSNLGSGIKVIGVGDFRNNFSVPYHELEEINPEGVIGASDLLEKGDIVFVRSNGNPELVGRCLFVAQYPTPITHSGFTIRLRFLYDQVFPLFYAHYFRSGAIRQALAQERRGTNITNLSQSILGELLVPIPPIPEQRKIAQILGTWDAAIGRVEQLIAALQRRKQGLMQRLLTGQVRFAEFASEAWATARAGDIFVPISRRKNGEAELLSVTQEQGVLPRSLLETRVTMPSGATDTYKLVEPGNFVISLRSFQGGIEYSQYRGLVSPAYTVLEPKAAIADNFYKHLFKSSEFISRLGVAIIGIRDGKQINFADFAGIRLAYPSLREQQAIGRVLDTCDEEITLHQQKLAALRQQKQGLMQRLLTGQVRVKGEEAEAA